MQKQSEEILSQFDLVSIHALVEQLAFKKKFNRENTYCLLETEFNVTSIKHIKRSDLDRAVAFLVDLQDMHIH